MYRYEKEANGDGAIVIDGWNGIAPDPYTGTGRMRAVNLEVPGEVSAGYPITPNTLSGGGSSLGTPIADSTRFFSYGSPVSATTAQSYAILDANGRVWESASGGAISGTFTFLSSSNSTTGSSSLDGVAYWLGYLFKTRGANIDYWNGSTWSTGWKTTLTTSVPHPMFVGTDNVLYIGNGNYLASITAPTPSSFDPTSGATYSFEIQKLQLPVYDQVISISEVGGGGSPNSNLLVGGALNNIYPWDKTSPSFSLPIYVADTYIKKMVSVNQNAFIFPGNVTGRGRIYITNGSQANLFYKIPDYIFGVNDPYFVWGDIAFHRNNLVMGFSANSNSAGASLAGYDLVWALDIETKKFRSISRLFNSTSFKANVTSIIPNTSANFASGFDFVCAWYDPSGVVNPAIGYAGSTAGVGSGDIITEQIPVGTFTQKKTFTQVEFKLRTPLESGESISITPIVDGVSSTALSFSPTVTTGSISGVAPVTFQNAQWLAFDVTIIGNSGTSGCRLKEIRVR